ncbi:MAG: YdeI/OmpD-associated family protein [Bacteroidetes bacterium]|nr:YdeI/OmpD-associated family protein [Bacteroidota bacterium]MBS1540631.1 YdeI/OmpD-associated family protein [Bacteroidota bacterium]
MQVVSFVSSKEWRKWLAMNYAKTNGVWLRFFKKDSGEKTVTYPEALEEALCYGWIDGQANKYDVKSYIQKFTPRRPRSIWSKRNAEKAERLIQEGKMKKAGMQQIELAKADGRWQRAYDSSKNMKVPEDFLKQLSKNKKAKTFFDGLNKANLFAIVWRLQTAKKPETREKRLKKILVMMREGKKFH